MLQFTLRLFGRGHAEIAESDFAAQDTISALKIAQRVFEACSDSCERYQLLKGGACISSVAPDFGMPQIDLSEFERQVVLEIERFLYESFSQLRDSKLLLADLNNERSTPQIVEGSQRVSNMSALKREQGPLWLSERERQCAQLVARGHSDREIGDKLGLSERTVNEYMDRVKRKLDVYTRIEAIVMAVKLGLIET